MQIVVDYGLEQATYNVAVDRLVAPGPSFPTVADPAAAVRAALENPFAFPALRQALTPEDHVAVVVDETLPGVAGLLVPILEQITGTGVAAEAITLLCPPSASRQAWLEELPEAFEEVRLEVHDPANRKGLSYLATMKKGRRLYLNRTLVDADQAVVLSGRRYDPILGHAGAQGSIFPALSDEGTRQDLGKSIHLDVAGTTAWPVREKATEAAWLLGVPFFVQIIEGAGDGISHVVAGSVEACDEGRRLQDERWRRTVPRAVDLVVASLGGDPARHTFADFAAALACAARVVRPGGRMVLLGRARPELGAGMDVLVESDDPRRALDRLRKKPAGDQAAAMQWAQAAEHAHIYVLSGLDGETVEGLFATPLENTGQVQRLLDAAESCLFLADAHKTLAIFE